MPYKERDWKDLVFGLQNVHDLLEQAKNSPEKKGYLLGLAVLSLWTFGEYAVNVVLELKGEGSEQNHRQAESEALPPRSRAAAFAIDGSLQRDYSVRLQQLERYRLKASHRSYARGRSDNYTSADVRNCLDEMNQLRTEVEALLRAKGKLS